MNEQTILLFFLITATGFTLFLYLWKAKKEMQYKKDERWQLIQVKAGNAANNLNYILILLFAAADAVLLFSEIDMTTPIPISLNRLFTYGALLIGLRNMVELFALKYFDKRI